LNDTALQLQQEISIQHQQMPNVLVEQKGSLFTQRFVVVVVVVFLQPQLITQGLASLHNAHTLFYSLKDKSADILPVA